MPRKRPDLGKVVLENPHLSTAELAEMLVALRKKGAYKTKLAQAGNRVRQIPFPRKFSLITPETGEPFLLSDKIRKMVIHNPRMPPGEVAEKLGTTKNFVNKVKSSMRKKGYWKIQDLRRYNRPSNRKRQ